MEDLAPHLSKLTEHRNFGGGRLFFSEAQCGSCHHLGDDGGSFGPELTSVGNRMSAHDILESILDPSKVIVDQYQNTVLTLTNDDVVIGRVISEDDKKLVVLTDGMNMTREMIFKTNIVSRRVSKISPMPEGLVNFMNEDQIWDLIAYLESGGQIPSRLKK